MQVGVLFAGGIRRARIAPDWCQLPPLGVYEAFRLSLDPRGGSRRDGLSAAHYRRIAILKQRGGNDTDIGRALGISPDTVKLAFARLPEELRHEQRKTPAVPGTIGDGSSGRRDDPGPFARPGEGEVRRGAQDMALLRSLHCNAAMRLLRRELVRMEEARLESIASIDDPRLPSGVAVAQIQQIEAEQAQIREAHDMLEVMLDDEWIEAA